MSGSTAVVVLLPDAEPLLEAVRQIGPRLVRPLPAHVSLLYPGPAPGPGVLHEVTRLSPPSEVELRQVITGEDGFVGVAVPALDAAVARLRASFPAATPYGGRYGETPPAHLTVALGATRAQVGQVTRLVRNSLPRMSKVLGPYLLERTGTGWRPVTG
ncbi:2'-5' RNA ligase family protein [Amycolatopsis acidiphila]|uniref:2'-5' RNA ligase family protein n=1 Tax=Amycolatopsis acidiphila TaxID=715473 RepID=A0A557ZY35_9PSEU|nr:2'-5' RNA ligase family protein [Amycolatopsis acidiphila]TVT16925.1 2'-5' RNA ligase family protein [Amycolatopsis acidiphila]UIJ62094.1 2'-5' RNA ligase family protein [Amycolatopsis acidiphila]GHG91848.1 hypothetical protein GCM10017788_68220 [Amycolatopsis acidiphila]